MVAVSPYSGSLGHTRLPDTAGPTACLAARLAACFAGGTGHGTGHGQVVERAFGGHLGEGFAEFALLDLGEEGLGVGVPLFLPEGIDSDRGDLLEPLLHAYLGVPVEVLVLGMVLDLLHQVDQEVFQMGVRGIHRQLDYNTI